MAQLVELTGVDVERGGVQILRDVHLAMASGEIYGLIGPNGAGKSTTIAVIAGLVARSGGRVRVCGLDPAEDPVAVRRKIGVMPEHNGLYAWMTAGDYLSLFVKLRGVEDHPRPLLECVGLWSWHNRRIGTFSHGMRQRLALARALIGRPDLLVLDEPTNGLDPQGRRDLHDLLLKLRSDHAVGVLLCTHMLNDVERLCDRIGIISAGEMLAEGSIGDLTSHYRRRDRYRLQLEIGGGGGTIPQGIRLIGRDESSLVVDLGAEVAAKDAWCALINHGWPIREIHKLGSGLEDLYFDIAARGDRRAI
jgi:ABC-2 type transport system ATP-binding protein